MENHSLAFLHFTEDMSAIDSRCCLPCFCMHLAFTVTHHIISESTSLYVCSALSGHISDSGR